MYSIGEKIYTKKNHACGKNEWEVKRIGADIKLVCTNCQREIMLPKRELDKKIIKKD
ncbi:hypothetical protein BN85413560 [Alteracholeplasma palmae J233]|uniref:DUF951 domain-containing protein n=1 Tax=Alteracholeplasma palmae (strain ATCC 49389 / J233) TaxID=1318466 RepID=U4KLY0_ALTPJ|nr:DUF951 domain-containing protein [Alteracholeplasma palmae]CCV64933.1 hypothetical protein BN85413560 [Alteracholeplasma palmae J233]